MDTFIVHNDGVALPVTVGGTGPRALFVPGMSITAAALGELVEELRGFVELATFDLRGHGASGTSDDYGYAAFASDAAAVTDALTAEGPVVLMGFSLGADLALDQAARRRDTPSLFLLDGGTPLTEPFLDEDELAEMHDLISREPPEDYALSADQHIAALREIDTRRRSAAQRYDDLTCPVTMVMSETIAGTDDARAHELNAAWRRGVDDLVAAHPGTEVHRLPGGHDLPLVHAHAVAAIVRERLDRLYP